MKRFELTREYINGLQQVIEQQDTNAISNLVKHLHPADIAEIFDDLNIDEAKFVYRFLEPSVAADVLVELEDDVRDRFLKSLTNKAIAEKFIYNMDSDDAADILGDLPISIQEEILSYLKDIEQAGDIIDLLHYEEDTAGGLMAKELISVNMQYTVTECLQEITNQTQEVEDAYYVYVVDDNDLLKGTISFKKLLSVKRDTRIERIMRIDVISVRPDTSGEEVARIMDKYDLVALPVIDSIGRLLGRITIDDVVDFIREEADRDYQLISGITQDVEPSDKVWELTRARIPWLMIGVAGGIFGALVMGSYEADLLKHAAMAFFVPLIAAMGGNVGVQSSSIVVQSLANNTFGMESTTKKLFKEFAVAVINGLICSLIVFVYNLIFSDSFTLTVTVSTALFVVIIFASIFGTLVPMILNRFKIDPALATGPFITTANDIFGLFLYLMIGRMFFSWF